MITRLMRSGLSLLVYFCLATCIAQVILFVYLSFAWRPDRQKLIQVLAVLQDVDPFATDEAERQRDEVSSEQVSYEQILEARAAKLLHLQLREQALEKALGQLAFEQRRLTEDKKQYEQLRESFNNELLTMQEGATTKGRDVVMQKLSSIKAKQAKELLAEMLNNDEMDEVVVLLSAMPDVKAAKIIAEFKLPEEIEQMYEILRRIGKGFPDSKLAADTREKLAELSPSGP